MNLLYKSFKIAVLIITLLTTQAARADHTDYVDPEVLLFMNIAVDESTIDINDSATFTLEVKNLAHATVATNAVVTINLPDGSSDITSQGCIVVSELTMNCTLAELSPDEIAELTVSAVFSNEGHKLLQASVVADQPLGGYQLNSTDSILLTVLAGAEPSNQSPVDLTIELGQSSNAEWEDYGSNYLAVTIKNQHSSNTALSPAIEIVIPENFSFLSGDFCSSAEQIVTCKVASLAPESETLTHIGLTTYTASEEPIALLATVMSSQPDVEPSNDEAELIVTLVSGTGILCGASNLLGVGCGDTVDSSDTNTDTDLNTDTDATNIIENVAITEANSGGGSISRYLQFLLVLLICCRYRLHNAHD